jgi:hypothetical protein
MNKPPKPGNAAVVTYMISPADARPRAARCGAVDRLTADEYATLLALPDRMGAVSARPACELGTGHGGGHVAFVVAADGGQRWWWLRWPAARAVVSLHVCGGVGLPDGDDCLLPAGHPGPHSFELLARPGRDRQCGAR